MSRLPRLPSSFIRRERLEKQLDQLAPLTVVHGLPGTGKTTLVTGWLERLGPTVRTLVVTAGPDGSEGLERQIVAGLADLGLIGDERVSLLPAEVAIEWAVHALGPGDHLVVVVDDAHFMTDEAWLATLVRLLHRWRPLHVVVCAYGLHRIAAHAAGRVDRLDIGPDDLRLTDGEVQELATAAGRMLDDAAVSWLSARFEGWAGPTVCALAGDDRSAVDEQRGTAFVNLHVLPLASACGMLDLAIELALARRLDESLAQELASADGPHALESLGMLGHAVDGGRRVYTMPRPIREALRQTAVAHPARTRASHRRLAAWFAREALATDESDDGLLAFRHAVDGEDWELAHRVWVRFESRFSMAHTDAYLEVLTAVPDGVMEQRPAWQVARGAMSVASAGLDRPADAGSAVIAAHLDAARAVDLNAVHLPLHDLLYLGTYQMCALREVGVVEAHDYGEELAARVRERLDRGEQPGDRLAFFLLQHAGNKFDLDDELHGMRLLRQGWRLPPDSTAPHHRALIASLLAEHHALRGDHDQAAEWIVQQQRWNMPGSWGYEVIEAPCRVAAALGLLDRLELDEVATALAAIGDGQQPLPSWPVICHLHAHLGLHTGDPEAALGLVTAARAEGDHRFHATSPVRALTRIVEAELLIGLGRAQQAGHLLHGCDQTMPAVAAAVGFAALACGRDTDARAAVRRVAARPASPRQRLDLALVDGVAALRLGDARTVERRRRHVLGLVTSTGIRRALAKVDPAELDGLGVTAELRSDDRLALANARPVFPSGQRAIVLTRREETLVQALREGLTRQETARRDFVSLNTVKSQYRQLYRKLGVSTGADALLVVDQLGLLADQSGWGV